MRVCLIFLLLPVFITGLAQPAQVRRALENIKDGEFEKARILLLKANEKDATDPTVQFAWSSLYKEANFAESDLDSANYFILRARNSYRSLPLKESEKLKKSGFDSLLLESQKRQVDSLAYVQAIKQHTIQAYTSYIMGYSSSKFLSEIVRERERLAFELAKQDNTTEAYQTYIRNYPEAPEAAQAQVLYEKIKFTEATSANNLTGYRSFVRENPTSVFLPAVEEKILSIMTTGNRKADFQEFLSTVKSENVKKRAVDIYFHILKEDTSVLWDRQPWITDSLLAQLNTDKAHILPVFDEGLYNFISESGERIFKSGFAELGPEYRCDPVDSDILLLKGSISDLIATRDGSVLFEGRISHLEDLGYGIMKIGNDGKFGLLHKSGKMISPMIYQEVKLLDGQFLAMRQGRNWMLSNFFGTSLINATFDSVTSFSGSVLLLREDRWAVVPLSEMRRAANNESPNLVFLYEEVETIGEKLWVRTGLSEGLINAESGFDIPLDIQQITPLASGYLLRKNGRTDYLDNAFNTLLEDCERVSVSTSFISARKQGRTYLINVITDQVSLYDSVKLWGQHYAFAKAEKRNFLAFGAGSQQMLNDNNELRLLRAPDAEEFIQLTAGKSKQVVDRYGKVRFSGQADEIYPVGNGALLVILNKKSSLYGIDGQKLLSEDYDLVAGNGDGTFSLLRAGKLGFFDPSSQVIIPTQYDRKVIQGRKGEYIACREGGCQILDTKGKSRYDDVFEEIEVWNDSLYLVKEEGLWSLYDMQRKRHYQEGIVKILPLSNNNSTTMVAFETAAGTGVIDKNKGVVLFPEFDFVSMKGPFLVAEQYIKSAERWFLFYFNLSGKPLWHSDLDREKYLTITCE